MKIKVSEKLLNKIIDVANIKDIESVTFNSTAINIQDSKKINYFLLYNEVI